jgi:flagellar basal body-associated protein FliL
MNQETPVEPSTFSKLLAIWIVVVVIIIATAVVAGGQVYWWQKAVAQKEKQQLLQQIVNLQKEIQVLKTNQNIISNNNKPGRQVALAAQTTKINRAEKFCQAQLAGRERTVINLLQNGDLEQLAKYVHPKLGLHFSPFAFVDLKKDRVFSRKGLAEFFNDHHQYTWGYNEENGLSIHLTTADYYRAFVWDRAYADTGEISYSQNNSREFTTSNCFEVYPQAIIVEYRVSEFASKGKPDTNWRSIRLVFIAYNKNWYLVNIIHDQWTLQ